LARGNLPTSRGFFQVPVAQAQEGLDLQGMKKDDVSVEVADGHLALFGERKRETEETKDNVYRATFSEGVLEVSIPLPARPVPNVRKVQIEEPKTAAKSAA
jgi:HSP20 family protein